MWVCLPVSSNNSWLFIDKGSVTKSKRHLIGALLKLIFTSPLQRLFSAHAFLLHKKLLFVGHSGCKNLFGQFVDDWTTIWQLNFVFDWSCLWIRDHWFGRDYLIRGMTSSHWLNGVIVFFFWIVAIWEFAFVFLGWQNYLSIETFHNLFS